MLVLALAGVAPLSGAQQQHLYQNQPQLEEVVVVASKTPRSIHQVAANVSVVTSKQIKNQIATSINDVLEYVPGIDVESAGTRFGTEGVSIRGIGGNRVALLLDGVPLADQFDIGSFSNATRDFVNSGLISRAEVLHGPASSLYGSDAIGGVVAMSTPEPADYLRERAWGGEILTAYRDSNNSTHWQALMAVGEPSLGFLAAVSRRRGSESEPFDVPERPDRREFTRQSVLLKLAADEHAGQSWRLTYLHQDSSSQSNLQSMLGSGRFRSTTQLSGDDETDMSLITAEYDLHAVFPWFDSAVIRSYYQHSDVRQRTLDERLAARTPQLINRWFTYQQRIKGSELNLQKEFEFGEVVHRVAVGLDWREKTTRELRDADLTLLNEGTVSNTVLGETFPLRDFPVSDTEQLGAYLEYSVSGGKWTAIAGIRADDYQLDPVPDTIFLQTTPENDVVALSEDEVSPKLGLIYHATPELDLFLQYAHGFRAPPFEDANIGLDIPLFNIRAIPNPDLSSENSDGFDLGLRWQNSNTRLYLGLFHTDYKNFIETKVRLGLDPDSGRILFQSQNLSAAEIQGIEAGWQFKLPNNFSFDGSYYLADGSDKESGEDLNSVGPQQLVLGIGWSTLDGRRAVKLRGLIAEAWNDRDESRGELFKPDSYSTFDLFYTEHLNESVILRAGVRNISNTRYWHWSDVRGLSPTDPALPVLTRPGRNLSVSFEMHW